jgi:RES domain-containing protein
MSSSSECLTHRSLTQLLRTPILWAADLTGLSEGRGTPASHLRRHKQRSHFTRRFNWPRLGVSTTRLPMRTASRILAAIFTICARTRSLLTAWPLDSYVKSQALALDLLAADSLGVVYPSVRHAGGTCVACFRPAAVSNVRFGPSYRLVWSGKSTPTITKESQ